MEQFVPVLCTIKRVSLSKQLQSRSFQSIKLSKIPRTNLFRLKGIEQKAVCQSRLFSRKNFVLSSYQALKFATIIKDVVETGVLLSDFAQRHCENADVPEIYFTYLMLLT